MQLTKEEKQLVIEALDRFAETLTIDDTRNKSILKIQRRLNSSIKMKEISEEQIRKTQDEWSKVPLNVNLPLPYTRRF